MLQKIDFIQEKFLSDIGLTEEEALLDYNCAPLSTRRDVAVLGLLHKCNLGEAHPLLARLFFRDPSPPNRNTAIFPPLHDFRMSDNFYASHLPSLLRSSIFSQIRIYNLLAPSLVDHNTVHDFESDLMNVVRSRCTRRVVNWQHCLSSRYIGHVYSISVAV